MEWKILIWLPNRGLIICPTRSSFNPDYKLKPKEVNARKFSRHLGVVGEVSPLERARPQVALPSDRRLLVQVRYDPNSVPHPIRSDGGLRQRVRRVVATLNRLLVRMEVVVVELS